MRRVIIALIISLVFFSSCTSRSEKYAKARELKEQVVVLKLPFSAVFTFEPMSNGNQIIQYDESDSTFITIGGKAYIVQDSIFVTSIKSFKRSRSIL